MPPTVRGRVEDLVAVSDLIMVSDEDAAWLSSDESAEELATRWLGLGPSVVALTSGAAGMLGLCRAGRVEVPAPRVEVADTVGAGDAAMDTLLDGLWLHDLLGGPARDALASVSTQTLETVVRHAARAAAITVSRPGADPPTRAELRLTGHAQARGSTARPGWIRHNREVADMSKALLAEFTVIPGAEARVAEMVTELAGRVRQEPGNLTFAVYVKSDNSRAYCIYEMYRDDEAFQAHLAAPYGGPFNAELADLIEEDGSVLTFLTEVP